MTHISLSWIYGATSRTNTLLLTAGLPQRIGALLFSNSVEMAPSMSASFISLTSCVGLQEPETAHSLSFAWASHIAASVLTGGYTLPNQSSTIHYKILIYL